VFALKFINIQMLFIQRFLLGRVVKSINVTRMQTGKGIGEIRTVATAGFHASSSKRWGMAYKIRIAGKKQALRWYESK